LRTSLADVDKFTGIIRSGVQKNVIGVRASENAFGKLDIALLANGRTPLVIFNQSADSGWVGLTVFGHAVEVTFDNFTFSTEETPIYPAPDNASG